VSDDQERLVANALRAQATSAGIPVVGAPAPRHATVDAGWLLLIALLLGLAAGTVVAVITLR
jgi:hypothetical protein